VSFMPSLVRNLLRIVDLLPSAYIVGMVAVLVSSRNQRLGDLAAGTLVVQEVSGGRERRRKAPPPAMFEAIPDDLDLTAWDVSAVTAEDVATVRQFLARRAQLDGQARARLARTLADSVGAKVARPDVVMSNEAFLEAVAAAKTARA
jgi:hypothetical protein